MSREENLYFALTPNWKGRGTANTSHRVTTKCTQQCQLFVKAVTKLHSWHLGKKDAHKEHFAHSWIKNEICLFTLQGSVSGSSWLHFQIDFDAFHPSTSYKQLQTLSCTLWITTSYTKLCTLLHIQFFIHVSKIPTESYLRIGPFVTSHHTSSSSSQYKPPIFTIIIPCLNPWQCLGSLYCCCSVSETFLTG